MTTERTGASDSTASFEKFSTPSGIDVVALWSTSIEKTKSKPEDIISPIFGTLTLCDDGDDVRSSTDDKASRMGDTEIPIADDDPPPIPPPAEVVRSIAALQQSNNPVDKALAEALSKMFSQDKGNIDSYKVDDAKLILELANRDKPPLDKSALSAVLSKLEFVDHRHGLLELIKSGTNTDAVKEIVDLLKSDDPKHNSAAELLLRCMTSDKSADNQLFTDMIGMLKQPATRDDALTMLCAPFPFTPEHMAAMLELKETGTPEQFNQLKELIASGDSTSASRLLDLNYTNPELFERASALLDAAQRNDVLDMINKFANPEHISRILDLVETPEKKPLLDTLLNSPTAAGELFDLMGSSLPADKTMAENLTKMLTGTNQERKEALQLLSISDRVQRENAHKLLADPITAPGIRHLLQLRADAAADPRRRNRTLDAANEMLEYATSLNGKTEGLTTFLKLLGGSNDERSFAISAFRSTDIQTFNSIMSAVGSASPADSIQSLSRLMNGPDGSRAIDLLMQTRRSDKDLYTKVIEHLKTAKPEEITELTKAMRILDDPIAVRRLLELRVDPAKQEFYRQVVRDLTLPGGQNEIAARRLFLGMATPGEERGSLGNSLRDSNKKAGDVDPTNAAELEILYANAETRDLARALLANAKSPEDLVRLTKIFTNKDNAKLAADATAFLKQKPELTKAFLTQMQNAEQMKEFLKVYGDKTTSTAAVVLCDMLRTDSGAAGLMSMLASNHPIESALGKRLLDMLNTTSDGKPLETDKYYGWINRTDTVERGRAVSLLQSGLSSDAIAMLKTSLESDPDDPSKDESRFRAMKILELAGRHPTVRAQLSEMVTNLGSEDPQQRQLGERLFDLFKRDSALAVTILTKTARPAGPPLQAIFQIADSNSKLKAVAQLLEMRDLPRTPNDPDLPPPPQPSISAAAILDLAANPDTAGGAKLVVDLLANPATQARGNALINALSMGRERGTHEMLRIMTAPKDEREKALGTMFSGLVQSSAEPGNQRILGNIARVLGAKDTSGEAFKLVSDALLDPKTKDQALDALKSLTSEQSCTKFFRLAKDPKFAGATEYFREVLKNGSSKEIARIEAVLTDERQSSKWVLGMLNDPTTHALARTLIQLSSNDGIERAQRLYEEEKTRPLLVDLLKKAKTDPAFVPAIEQLLASATASQFKAIYDLLIPDEKEEKSSRTKKTELARQLLMLATSDENAENRFGRQMLRLLSETPPLSVDEVRALHDRFRSEEGERPYISALIGFTSTELKQLEKRFEGPANEAARAFFIEMFADSNTLDGDRRAALPLFQELLSLENSNPGQAAGIWRMINDPRYRQSARRAIEALTRKDKG